MDNEKRKKRIIKLREKDQKSFIEISRIISKEFGKISKARIHQIFSGYSSRIWYRKKVFARDNYKCQWNNKCKKDKVKKIIVHHIDGNNRNNKIENLITLCQKCHIYFHRINGDLLSRKKICFKCSKYYFKYEGNLNKNLCGKCYMEFYYK